MQCSFILSDTGNDTSSLTRCQKSYHKNNLISFRAHLPPRLSELALCVSCTCTFPVLKLFLYLCVSGAYELALCVSCTYTFPVLKLFLYLCVSCAYELALCVSCTYTLPVLIRSLFCSFSCTYVFLVRMNLLCFSCAFSALERSLYPGIQVS